jgi:hypothetical protein
MTLEQIKDEIRNLGPSEKVELYKWFDYASAADLCSNGLCSRIGVERSLEIRRAISEKSRVADLGVSAKTECDSRSAPKPDSSQMAAKRF